MSASAWLIEIPLDCGLYYCAPGDWCSNPNHAHRFSSKAAADGVLATMQNPSSMRVAEHEWPDEVERHKPHCEKFKALLSKLPAPDADFPADVPCTCSRVPASPESGK